MKNRIFVGGQFTPVLGGQFNPELVVNLNRYAWSI